MLPKVVPSPSCVLRSTWLEVSVGMCWFTETLLCGLWYTDKVTTILFLNHTILYVVFTSHCFAVSTLIYCVHFLFITTTPPPPPPPYTHRMLLQQPLPYMQARIKFATQHKVRTISTRTHTYPHQSCMLKICKPLFEGCV